MTDAGIGQSTCVGIGGDPVIGTQFLDDPPAVRGGPRDRDAIVLIGEIGGDGRGGGGGVGGRAPRGRPEGGVHRRPHGARGQADGPRRARSSRAAAGTAASKVEALEAAGFRVAGSPTELPALLREAGYRRLVRVDDVRYLFDVRPLGDAAGAVGASTACRTTSGAPRAPWATAGSARSSSTSSGRTCAGAWGSAAMTRPRPRRDRSASRSPRPDAMARRWADEWDATRRVPRWHRRCVAPADRRGCRRSGRCSSTS